MRHSNPVERARAAFERAVTRAHVQARQSATIGWRKSATNVIIDVPGRPNYAYVTVGNTVDVALNRAGVPLSAFLPVFVIRENDSLVIVARDNADAAVLANVPDSQYGVPAHPLNQHSDTDLSSPADGDAVIWDEASARWVPGAGVGEPGLSAYEVAVANGFVGTEVEWLASLEGPQGPQGEPGDAADIAAETNGAATDDSLDDADLFGRVSGGIWVKTSWANLKTALTTLFNDVYVTIAADQTISGIKTFASRIVTPIVRAASAAGLAIQDDGGNLGVFIEDGGQVGVGTSSPTGGLHVLDTRSGSTAAVVIDNPADDAVGHLRLRDSENTRYRADFNINPGGGLGFNAYDDTAGAYQPITLAGNPVSINQGDLNISNNVQVGGQITVPEGRLLPNPTTILTAQSSGNGSVGTSETVLMSYSLPGNLLGANGDQVEFEFWIGHASNSNVKTLRLYIEPLLVIEQSTTAAGMRHVRGRLVRVNSTSLRTYYTINGVPGLAGTTINLAIAHTFSVRGQGQANNDLVGQGLFLEWKRAPT